MTTEQIIAVAGLVIAVISVIAGFTSGLVPQLYNDWFSTKPQQYKFFYMKVNCLKLKEPGAVPFYKRHVKRLDKDVDVFSEVQCYRLNIFSREQKSMRFSDRSSGVVDLQIFHPLQEELIFTDEKAANNPNSLTQRVDKKSRVYFSRATYLNGFQPNEEDMSMKMEKDTEEAILLVDFSSLPNFEQILKKDPVGFHISSGKKKSHIPVTPLQPGIYSVKMEHLKEGDVIRMDFSINWGLL